MAELLEGSGTWSLSLRLLSALHSSARVTAEDGRPRTPLPGTQDSLLPVLNFYGSGPLVSLPVPDQHGK